MDKSISWLKTGVEVFADTGKLELNTICKKIGKSKSSFYNIYPNLADSRGFDRYIKDVIEHHERVMAAYNKQLREMFVIYGLPEIIDEVGRLEEKQLVYLAFTAQLRRVSDKSPELQAYCDRAINEDFKVVHEFWEFYNIQEDEIMDDLEMRLLYDSYLNYKDEDFLKDFRSIAFTRIKHKGFH